MGGAAPTRPVRVPTALGTIALELPQGAELVPDPGAADGALLMWAPDPSLGGFSLSHGAAAGRRADDLLALERGFARTVDVAGEGDDELRLIVETPGSRDLVEGLDGRLTGSSQEPRRERVRFRFWEQGDQAVRVGYRLDERAPAALGDAFDRATDSARLEPS
ncbi:hypothetical protein [Miltoncostaea marina]|uniref:hypothetical protein n=1 Tax=Miltoncostaea marina TaxID=2843215 RepID=UPI001C3D0CFA|nr:hypothetical protein [Miltoncostaea marina]